MLYLRNCLCCAALLLLLPMTTAASESSPEEKEDSVSQIASDLKSFGREYVSLSKPSRMTMTNLAARLNVLEIRCDRLGGESNANIKPMLAVIRDLKEILKQRSLKETKRREMELKPYVFSSVSGPTLSDGGHSEKGAEYLLNEVQEFIKHYRGLEHTEFSHNEVFLESSRRYFKRTIESSVKTALQPTKEPKPGNAIIIRSHGGIVYGSYSPQENLQWALNVARVAQYFESHLGGSSEFWVQCQNKIQVLAAERRLKLK